MTDKVLFTDNDVPPEEDFSTVHSHAATSEYWESGGSATLNASTPSIDTPALTAYINGYPVEVDARTGLSLTDSATNYVYLSYDPNDATIHDPGSPDPISYTVNTTASAPSDPSLLIWTVDTTDDTVIKRNDLPSAEIGRREYAGEPYAVVYTRDGWWYADGQNGAIDDGVDSATVLQSAVNSASKVFIADGMRQSSGNRLTSTVTVNSALIDARYNLIEGDADPLFDFRADAQGLHNAKLQGADSNGNIPANTLLYANESGRRGQPFLSNVRFTNTDGYAAHLAGIQQTSLYNLAVSNCGDGANSGGGLRFTDNEAGDMGSNHFQVFGLQFHGSTMGGPLIKSQTVNGYTIALNGMKLVGLDAENGNQSGSGSGQAHIELNDAQRLKWSHVYLRGLDAADYAIDYNSSNGTNVLDDAEIRWDGGVSTGAAIRKYRGVELRITNSDLHPSGNGGATAITGDLTNADLTVLNTEINGNIDLAGNLSGSARFDGGSVDDLNIRKASLTVHGTDVTSTSGGINESKNILVAGGETLPALQTRDSTDANGQVTLDWETDGGILFGTRPMVNITVEASGQSAYYTMDAPTYNSTTYYAGITVTVEDYSGTAVGSGENVTIDVRAQS